MNEEVYYLKIFMEDGSTKYCGHSNYLFDEKPNFRSLMTLKDARAKRTKLLKKMDILNADNSDEKYSNIEIRKAIIYYED